MSRFRGADLRIAQSEPRGGPHLRRWMFPTLPSYGDLPGTAARGSAPSNIPYLVNSSRILRRSARPLGCVLLASLMFYTL